jgi:hypothetical protein
VDRHFKVSLSQCCCVPLLLSVGCSPPSLQNPGAFKAAHLDSQAIPALISYCRDLGSFPSSDEGWRALFSCPAGPKDEQNWKGPYLTNSFEDVDGATVLCLLNGRAYYTRRREQPVVELRLVCRKTTGEERRRVITLCAVADVRVASLSKRQEGLLAKMKICQTAIEDYRREYGVYPGGVDESGKDIAHSKPLLAALANGTGIRYERYPGDKGYHLFFFGQDVAKYNGYDEFSKRGECQLIVIRTGAKESSFFAYGDSAD